MVLKKPVPTPPNAIEIVDVGVQGLYLAGCRYHLGHVPGKSSVFELGLPCYPGHGTNEKRRLTHPPY